MANFITQLPLSDPSKMQELEDRFDYKYYIAHNPDIAKTIGTNYQLLWQHFVKYGWAEKRRYRLLNATENDIPVQAPEPPVNGPPAPTDLTDPVDSIEIPNLPDRIVQLIAWPTIYGHVVRSCVSVYVPVEPNVWYQGMGSVVTEQGLFITSCYLVSDKKFQAPLNSIYVIIFPEYSLHTATLVAYEAYTDIALYQINLPTQLLPRETITWGSLDKAILGNPLYSIGQSANNRAFLPIIGILQDKGYEEPPKGIAKSIVTSLPATSGYLGAGIFDRLGHFIGQISWIKRNTTSHLTGGIAVDVVRYITDWMVQYKTNYPVPHLGLMYIENTPQLAIRVLQKALNRPVIGVVVIYVVDGSPAHLAGIRPGQIITKFNDKMIGSGASASQMTLFSHELIKQKPRDYIYLTDSTGRVYNIQLEYSKESYMQIMRRKIYASDLRQVNIIERHILDIFTDYHIDT